AETALEWIAAGGVEDGDFDPGALAVHLGKQRFEAVSVASHVRLGPDLGIGRDHVGLPVGLNPEAAEEEKRGRAGPDLAVEAIDRRAHSVVGEVLADLD